MLKKYTYLIYLMLLPCIANASNIFENTDRITDPSDVIYLYYKVAKEPIDITIFLDNVMSGRSSTWGEASKFTKMANSYRFIKDDFEKRDFLKEVESEIYKHKPEFKNQSLRMGTSFKVSKYDFEKNQYIFTYSDRKSLFSKKFGIEWSFPAKTVIVKPRSESEARVIEKIAAENRHRLIQALMSLTPIRAYKKGNKYSTRWIVKAEVDTIEVYKKRLKTFNSSSGEFILLKFIPSIPSSLTPGYIVSPHQ